MRHFKVKMRVEMDDTWNAKDLGDEIEEKLEKQFGVTFIKAKESKVGNKPVNGVIEPDTTHNEWDAAK